MIKIDAKCKIKIILIINILSKIFYWPGSSFNKLVTSVALQGFDFKG